MASALAPEPFLSPQRISIHAHEPRIHDREALLIDWLITLVRDTYVTAPSIVG